MFDFDSLEDIDPAEAEVTDYTSHSHSHCHCQQLQPEVVAPEPLPPSFHLLLGSDPLLPRNREVEVCVSSLSGEAVASFRLPRTCLLIDVKHQVERKAGILASEQRLLCGPRVLDGASTLLDVVQGTENSLQLTLVRVQGPSSIVLSGGLEDDLLLWDLRGEDVISRWGGVASHALALDLHWASRRALVGGADGIVRMWDLEAGQASLVLSGHLAAVSCLAVDWEASRAVTGDQDGCLKYWDLDTGSTLVEIAGHHGGILCAVLEVSQQTAMTGGMDCVLRVWDLELGEEMMSFEGHMMPINCVAGLLARKPEPVAITGSFGVLRLWSLTSFPFQWDFPGHNGAVTCLSVNWATFHMVSAGSDSTLLYGKLNVNSCSIDNKRWFRGHNGPVTCLSVDWDVLQAASGSEDGTIRLWDLNKGTCLQVLQGHIGGIRCLGLCLDASVRPRQDPASERGKKR